MLRRDCPHCDECESVQWDDDYSQYLISFDGDNVEMTSESEPCDECGETVTVTVYATIHAVQGC